MNSMTMKYYTLSDIINQLSSYTSEHCHEKFTLSHLNVYDHQSLGFKREKKKNLSPTCVLRSPLRCSLWKEGVGKNGGKLGGGKGEVWVVVGVADKVIVPWCV